MLGTRDVGNLRCWGREMLGMWDVESEMFARMWDFDLQNATKCITDL